MPSSESNSSSATRRRPQHTVEGTDLEVDNIFPHIPLLTNVDFRLNEAESESDMDLSLNLGSDKKHVALLMFLYILQGIPLGLAGAVPMILQARKISYKEQAMFSFVYWPYSVKLLWAPLVDSLYFRCFGRRKSWLVPSQYLIGLFMIVLSSYIPYMLGETDGDAKVVMLTVTFFMLNFLAATQDIAVDGWAITMLSRRNVGWASTCNGVGQTAGYFLGNVLFLALESPDFCNSYLREVPQKDGIVTLSGFLYFWGIVFFITTTLVWFLKHEADDTTEDDHGIITTYLRLWDVIRLPNVKQLAVILLTAKIAFSVVDSLTGLKLIEEGMPKERLAIFAIPLIPLQIIFPLIISKYTAGPTPMNIWLTAFPLRLFMGIPYAVIVWWTFGAQTTPGHFPWYYYGTLLFTYGLHQMFLYSMFVAIMALNAKVSDPAIGGTYMTLLNTMSNLGGNWPATIALWCVDYVTWKSCFSGSISDCDSPADLLSCEKSGGSCRKTVDGYYIESAICIIIGIVWYRWYAQSIRRLDRTDIAEWKCPTR